MGDYLSCMVGEGCVRRGVVRGEGGTMGRIFLFAGSGQAEALVSFECVLCTIRLPTLFQTLEIFFWG